MRGAFQLTHDLKIQLRVPVNTVFAPQNDSATNTLMKKTSKGAGSGSQNPQLLLLRLAEAEKNLELARQKAQKAKVAFKHFRKAFKQAKKASKQARKLAKAAVKAVKTKTEKARKKSPPTRAKKPLAAAAQRVITGPSKA